MSSVFASVAHAIGNTPLVSVSRFCKAHGLKGQMFAKLEHLNPGFSKKDRIARRMVIEARECSALKPGQPVVELTSGNTGIGLAIACAAFEHPFTAVMSRGNSVERARMMQALGANVVLVKQAPGSNPGFVSGEDIQLVQQEAERLTRELGAFRADQFNLLANENAHYSETGPEIWNAVKPRAFVDFAGTGGTFSGIAKFLKEQDPSIWCAWVLPSGNSHRIQGGGYFVAPDGKTLRFEQLARERGHIDEILTVTDEESITAARDLARLEGVFGGFSTGANAAAAMQLLKSRNDDSFSVVFIVCDSGLKYLSTDLYPVHSS